MNPLILNIIIVSLICLLYQITPNKNRLTASLFIFATFSCLWYVHSMVDIQTVPDLQVYDNYFYQASQLSLKEAFIKGTIDDKIEVGYVVFFKLASYITSDFQFFLWIYSFILLFLYFRFFKNESPYIAVSILLLLVGPYNQSLYVIRQHLAVAVLLSSYEFIKDRSFVKFLLVELIAFSLHRSALIFIPIYFLYGLDSKKLIVSIVSIAILSFTLISTVLNLFVDTFSGYDSYLDVENGGANYKRAVIAGIYLIVFVFFLKEHVFDEGINKFSFIMIALSFILALCGIGYNPTGRLSIYFSVGSLVGFPLALSYTKNTILRFIIFLAIFLMNVYIHFFGSAARGINSLQLTGLW